MSTQSSLFTRFFLLCWRWRWRAAGALAALFALVLFGIGGFIFYAERVFDEEDIEDSLMWPDQRIERQQRRTASGHLYEVNNAAATFTLELRPEAASSRQRLFPDHASAIAYGREAGLDILPSVGLVHDKCKKVNDQLVRALETSMQEELAKDDLPGRRRALQKLATALLEQLEQAADEHRPAFEHALVYVAGALQAGEAEPPPELPSALAARAERMVEQFLADPVASRPVGFWDQAPELINIFRQDRFLVRGICLESDTAAAVALAGTVVDDPLLRDAFERSARFGSRLTNPAPEYRYSPLRLTELASPDDSWEKRLTKERLREIREQLPASPPFNTVSLALFTFSFSPEEALWLQMPDGFSSAQLIQAIEQGIIDLEPKPGSGWYDYQWYALETLVMPERGREDHKLKTNQEYRERLREIFLTAISRDRETHIKKLPTSTLGDHSLFYEGEVEVPVGPQFAVEPLPTVYLRLARAYRFLHADLNPLIERRLHETTMADPFDFEDKDRDREISVAAVLDRMAALNYGLYELACMDLGMNPEYLDGESNEEDRTAAVRLAEGWLARLADDPDLQQDTRIAVPLFEDPTQGQITSWACAGVRLEPLTAEYDEKPQVFGVKPMWAPSEYWVATEVFLEFSHQEKPLTRSEFRALCDAHPDEASLRAALGVTPRFETRRSIWFPVAVLIAAAVILAGLIVAAGRMSRKNRTRIVRTSLPLFLTALISVLIFLAAAPRLRTRIMVEHVLQHSRLLSAWTGMFYSRGDMDKSPRLAGGRLRGLLESMAEGRTSQSRYLAAYLFNCSYWQAEYEDKLALVEPEIAIPLLLRAAEDPVPQVAKIAIRLLGYYDRPETRELVQRKLRSTQIHPQVRLAAVWSAGKLRCPEWIDDLGRLLRHGSRIEQNFAINSLLDYENQRAREFLIEFLEERERGKSAKELEENLLIQRLRRDLFNDPEEEENEPEHFFSRP